jgi:hypothetical protein
VTTVLHLGFRCPTTMCGTLRGTVLGLFDQRGCSSHLTNLLLQTSILVFVLYLSRVCRPCHNALHEPPSLRVSPTLALRNPPIVSASSSFKDVMHVAKFPSSLPPIPTPASTTTFDPTLTSLTPPTITDLTSPSLRMWLLYSKTPECCVLIRKLHTCHFFNVFVFYFVSYVPSSLFFFSNVRIFLIDNRK